MSPHSTTLSVTYKKLNAKPAVVRSLTLSFLFLFHWISVVYIDTSLGLSLGVLSLVKAPAPWPLHGHTCVSFESVPLARRPSVVPPWLPLYTGMSYSFSETLLTKRLHFPTLLSLEKRRWPPAACVSAFSLEPLEFALQKKKENSESSIPCPFLMRLLIQTCGCAAKRFLKR